MSRWPCFAYQYDLSTSKDISELIETFAYCLSLYLLNFCFFYFLLGCSKVSLLILVCKQLNILSKELISRLRASTSSLYSFSLFAIRFVPHSRIYFQLELVGGSSSDDFFDVGFFSLMICSNLPRIEFFLGFLWLCISGTLAAFRITFCSFQT